MSDKSSLEQRLQAAKQSKKDFEESFDKKVDDAKKKKRKLPGKTLATILSVVLALGAIVGSIYASNKDTKDALDAVRDLKGEISKVESEIKAVDEAPVNIKVTKQTLHNANSAGAAVANLQNKYYHLSNGDELKSVAEELDQYFAEDSKNKRVPWFATQGTSVLEKNYTWTFQSSYDFKPDTTEVLWLCRGSDQKILAYATGIYDAKAKKFSQVSHKLTSYGQEFLLRD